MTAASPKSSRWRTSAKPSEKTSRAGRPPLLPDTWTSTKRRRDSVCGDGFGCRSNGATGRPATGRTPDPCWQDGLAEIPQPLLDAARQPFVAQAVIYTLLLSRDDEATRTQQLQLLQGQIKQPLYHEVEQLVGMALSLPAESRLPLVDLAIPALKTFSPQQYAQFRQVVEALVSADGKVDLYEYCLRMMLFSYLDVHFRLKKPVAIRYRMVKTLAQPTAIVLSTLAYVGQKRSEDVERAFLAGIQNLPGQLAIVPQQQCTLQAFDVALGELAQASPSVKREIISAVTACIAADGMVTLAESELLRGSRCRTGMSAAARYGRHV